MAAAGLIGMVAFFPATTGAVGGAHTAASQGGYDAPTRTLEGVFKIALFERAGRDDGCYPPSKRIAALIRKKKGLKASIVPGFGSVNRTGVVYVIKRGASCDRLILALRANGKTYVLDSVRGPVYVKGGAKKPTDVSTLRRLRGITLATREFRLSKVDDVERMEVRCPGGKFPLGGAMINTTQQEADGAGVYPHSYERLGVQRGWHVSAVFVDPSPGSSITHRATIQVLCARGVGQAIGPRRTVFLRPGQTKSVTARCPGNTKLLAGGFQRTDFRTPGGDFITESQAAGPRAWRVTGHAFGAFGGELTAMAYCVHHKGPVFTEVSASNPVPLGQSATATTPTCPDGRRLTSGGFSMNGSQNALFDGSSLNADGTWSATGFGYFGAAPSITAYGYCVRA